MKSSHYILLYITLLWQSCTQVQLCYEDVHPHATSLVFEFDWTGYEEEKPEQMYILMNRIINTKHYVFPVNIEDSNQPSMFSEEEGEEEISPAIYYIEGGEYSILALNLNEEYTDLQKIEDFANNTSAQLNDLEISLKTYDKAGFEEMEESSWTDFNPTYKYIEEPDMIFIGTQSQNLYYGTEKTIQIKPLNLTQTISIQFGLKPDPSIQIKKVIGEISGVIGKLKVLSLEIDDSETYRMCFYPEEITKKDDIIIYEGTINTFGILPNINNKEMTGPGVLHLAIYIEKEDGTNRVYHERINLINTITKTASTLSPEGLEKNRKLNPDLKEIVLEIDSYLSIDMDKVSSDDNGVDKWDDTGGIYIDTEA